MKFYQETRIQAIMFVSTPIGLVGALGFLVAGLVYNHIPYLFIAALLLLVVFVIVFIGQRWTQKTIDRVKKINDGCGNADDAEWIKVKEK